MWGRNKIRQSGLCSPAHRYVTLVTLHVSNKSPTGKAKPQEARHQLAAVPLKEKEKRCYACGATSFAVVTAVWGSGLDGTSRLPWFFFQRVFFSWVGLLDTVVGLLWMRDEWRGCKHILPSTVLRFILTLGGNPQQAYKTGVLTFSEEAVPCDSGRDKGSLYCLTEMIDFCSHYFV